MTASAGDDVTPTGWINDPTNSAYSLYNFQTRRNIFAAYAQAQLGFEVAGISVKGYASMHYEQTRQLINALSQQVTASGVTAFVPNQFRQDYPVRRLRPEALLRQFGRRFDRMVQHRLSAAGIADRGDRPRPFIGAQQRSGALGGFQ